MKIILSTLSLVLFVFTLSGQVYNDYLGAGHIEGIVITSSHEETPAILSMDGSGLGKNLQAASRFLSQATLGANIQQVIYADSIGFENWIEEQFEMTQSSYLGTAQEIVALLYQKFIDAGGDPNDFQIAFPFFRFSWWNNTINSPDQLRQKIALALSEILVISDESDLSGFGYGLANYYDILSENAFGNYKDLLLEVTLNPCMGFYLSHLNNPRSIPELNIHPDENYAREIMQLFTIGLYELNLDGTRKLDDQGQYIPTYDNLDITELAKVFTGLSAGDWVNDEIQEPVQFGIPIYYADVTIPMIMWEPWHQKGAKLIINDFIIPPGQTGMQDIEMAVEHLFNHPNVGPFLSSHLIKRLVKSNPTPGYVAKVAAVFNDNGQGVRGDLQAVVKAILLDPEARNCAWVDLPYNGKLREPLHMYTQLLKTFNAKTESDYFINYGFFFDYLTGQAPLSSETVFNFFLPDYQPNGEVADAGLVAPEFQIFNSSSSVGYVNALHVMVLADYLNDLPEVLQDEVEDFRAFLDVPEFEYLGQMSEGIVDYLDLVLGHGNLSEETKAAIIEQIDLLEEEEFRIRLAVYLTMLSPDFAIMK